MQCSKHPEHTADGVCAYSGKPFCQSELVEVEGRLYAKDNLGHVMADIKQRNHNPSPMVFMNAGGGGGGAAAAAVRGPQQFVGTKSKGVAIALALFLGGLGFHKFYLGRPVQGILYFVFCWTFIPAFLGLVEAIIYAFTSETAFARKYG